MYFFNQTTNKIDDDNDDDGWVQLGSRRLKMSWH